MKHLRIIYISIFLVALISFFLIFLFLLPTLRGILEESAQLTLQRKELASIKLLADNFENFEENYRSYENGLEEMENLLNQESLIDPEIPVNFINFFKEQAIGLNLDLKIFPVSFKEKQDGYWGYLTFRIDGTGKSIDIMKFFRKLENSQWLVEVINLNIVKQRGINSGFPEGEERQDLVGINLLIKVYAQD